MKLKFQAVETLRRYGRSDWLDRTMYWPDCISCSDQPIHSVSNNSFTSQ